MTVFGKPFRFKSQLATNLLLTLSLFPSLPSHADNLLDTLQAAERNDATIRAAYAQYHATRQNVPISRSALLPSISGSTSKSSGTFTPASGDSEQDTESENWLVTLDQSIYDHARWLSLKQANLQATQAEANYQNARQDLILRVADAYFSVLAAIDFMAFAEAQKKSVSQQLEQTQQRYEVGLIAITDVKESQASYDLAVAEEIQARNRLDTSSEALRTITNKYSENISVLKENIPFKAPEPNNIDQWVDSALKQNSALQSARLDVDIARKEVSRMRADHYPTLGIRAYKRSDTDIGGRFPDSTSDSANVEIKLSVPIFSGLRVRSSVKQAIYREDAAKEQFEFQKRTTTQQTRNFYRTVIADISRVNALNQALASTQAAYEATKAGFEVGTRNSAEVLVSLRETFRAKQNYSQARYDYILNTLRLKKSAGVLDLADIQAVNNWLN